MGQCVLDLASVKMIILLLILPAILADAEPQLLHHQPTLLHHFQSAPSLVQHADGRYFAVNAHLQPGQLFQAADGRLFTLATSSVQEVSQAVEEEHKEEEAGAVLAVGRNAEVEEDEPELVSLSSNSLNVQPDVTLFPNHPLAAVRAVPEDIGSQETSRTASSEAVTGSFQVIAQNRFRFPDRLLPSFNHLAGGNPEALQNLPEPQTQDSPEPKAQPVDSPLTRIQQQIAAQPELKPFVHTGRPAEIQPSPLRSLSQDPSSELPATNPFQPTQLTPRINPLFLQQFARLNSLHQTTSPSHQFLPLPTALLSLSLKLSTFALLQFTICSTFSSFVVFHSILFSSPPLGHHHPLLYPASVVFVSCFIFLPTPSVPAKRSTLHRILFLPCRWGQLQLLRQEMKAKICKH